eukprot:CAMPEP_0201579908 /NCGR_PEP_ID=MMETSP0190_2-20130828/27799_1 /ASSEMBLY_ACC=CAM_ASM_000263 /TAXON_ID=37353 /ORGANISM="Rosalina sp." /LENGTH=559 /DNA_ID=CAMNT_0048015013 /DNA_START=33 /DNA_END=1712 /DNA_ORIENTATION=+
MSSETEDPETRKLFDKIKAWISEDYNPKLAQACEDFYKEEEFDADGIRADINDCEYPDGDACALIDELSDNKGKDVLSTDQDKIKFAKALKDAINGIERPKKEVPTLKDLKGLNFTLSKSDPRKAGKVITEQCPGLFEEKDEESFKYVLAYGVKNNIPLLQWLVDTYLRYKINQKYGRGISEFNTTDFGNQYEFFKNPVCAKSKDKLRSVIASFWKRLVPEIQLKPPMSFVDDDINKFVEYYSAMADAINIMLNENENQMAPCQIDLWVIPKNSVSNLDDDGDSDGEEEEAGDGDQGNIDMIGNLEYRLKEDKDSFSYEKFEDIDLAGTRLSRFLSQHIVAKINNQRSQRLIIYVDRRDPSQTDKMKGKYFKDNYGQNDEEGKWDNDQLYRERKTTKKTWKDTIYIVQSSDTKFSELKTQYSAETSFWASSKCLLPRSKSCPSEKRTKMDPYFGARSDLNGYQFCLSWHIDSVDVIKTYWYHNAWGTRFFPIDAYKLWPMYFKKVHNGKKEQEVKKDNKTKLMKMRQVIDPGFEKWYELTVGKDDKGERDLVRQDWIQV